MVVIINDSHFFYSNITCDYLEKRE